MRKVSVRTNNQNRTPLGYSSRSYVWLPYDGGWIAFNTDSGKLTKGVQHPERSGDSQPLYEGDVLEITL